MKTQRHKTVTSHNSRWVWQRSVLGLPLRSKTHFETAEDAAIDSDLVAHYFSTVWKITLAVAMENQEHWSCLIFSRRSVALAESRSVEKALQQCVRDFVAANLPALSAFRDSLPPEPDYVKISRHAPSMKDPATCGWVRACESAARDEKDFSAINQDYLNSLIVASAHRLSDAIPPLRRAVKMLAGVTNEKLIVWRTETEALIAHLESDRQYIEEFSARLQQQQTEVASALANLPRPALT